jgi:hypothetical protein
MRSARSFFMAAVGAASLLFAVSVTTYAHDTTPQPAGHQTSRNDSGSSRLPFAIVGLGSLAAGAVLLRRAPKLID